MKTIKFEIEGMYCGGCSSGVSKSLRAREGIQKAEVSHETKGAEIEFNESIISEEDIFRIIQEKGYTPAYK